MKKLLSTICLTGAVLATGCDDIGPNDYVEPVPVAASACPVGSTDANTVTGYLADSAVSGVCYATATQSGVTGSDGAFTYLAGETVRFFIGATELGSVVGAAEINVFDLAGLTSVPTGRRDITRALPNFQDGPTLHGVANRAMLLHTLDLDGDATNGIEITAATAVFFENISLDLNQLNYDFASNKDGKALQKILRQAAAGDVLTARPIRDPGLAVQFVYDELGIDPGIYRSGFNERDSDADSNVDSTRTMTYNTAGQLVTDENDTDADGTADNRNEYSYDSETQKTRQSEDSDADGTPDYVRRWVRDDFGLLTYWEEDADADGTPNYTETQVYDDNGVLIRLEVMNTQPAWQTVTVFVPDSDGNLARHEFDDDGDGNYDRVETFTFDANGNWITRESDIDLDDTADEIYTRTYNTGNKKTRETRDVNADGNIDYVEDTIVNSIGQELRFERDSDGDGNPDFARVRTYDSNNRQLTFEHFDANGDLTLHTFSVYDADGNRTRIDRDTDGDGNLNTIEHFTYDTAGNRLTRSFDSDADGNPNAETVFSFDTNGNNILTEDDLDADGFVDRTLTRSLFQSTGIVIWF